MTPKEGLIDVYWLYDDGGLTLLLPHILTTRAKFAKCKLRVFFLSSSDNSEHANDYAKNMEALLSKFRIDFHVRPIHQFLECGQYQYIIGSFQPLDVSGCDSINRCNEEAIA